GRLRCRAAPVVLLHGSATDAIRLGCSGAGKEGFRSYMTVRESAAYQPEALARSLADALTLRVSVAESRTAILANCCDPKRLPFHGELRHGPCAAPRTLRRTLRANSSAGRRAPTGCAR